MTTSQSTIDVLLDQLSGLPHVRAHMMFGEYAPYGDRGHDVFLGLRTDSGNEGLT